MTTFWKIASDRSLSTEAMGELCASLGYDEDERSDTWVNGFTAIKLWTLESLADTEQPEQEAGTKTCVVVVCNKDSTEEAQSELSQFTTALARAAKLGSWTLREVGGGSVYDSSWGREIPGDSVDSYPAFWDYVDNLSQS